MRYWNWSRLRMLAAVAGMLCAGIGAFAQEMSESVPAIVLENESFRHEIASNGHNVAFIDKSTGSNYLKDAESNPLAHVTIAGTVVPVSRAAYADGVLTLGFGETGAEAAVRVEMHARHMVMEIALFKGESI
jgi:hypothetical protein